MTTYIDKRATVTVTTNKEDIVGRLYARFEGKYGLPAFYVRLADGSFRDLRNDCYHTENDPA